MAVCVRSLFISNFEGAYKLSIIYKIKAEMAANGGKFDYQK